MEDKRCLLDNAALEVLHQGHWLVQSFPVESTVCLEKFFKRNWASGPTKPFVQILTQACAQWCWLLFSQQTFEKNDNTCAQFTWSVFTKAKQRKDNHWLEFEVHIWRHVPNLVLCAPANKTFFLQLYVSQHFAHDNRALCTQENTRIALEEHLRLSVVCLLCQMWGHPRAFLMRKCSFVKQVIKYSLCIAKEQSLLSLRREGKRRM